MNRRIFLKNLLGSASALALLSLVPRAFAQAIEKMTHSEQEWKQMLTPEQFNVLREEGTERPFTSSLLNEHRAGKFVCAGCDLDLFTTQQKFDSGTGWPSFFDKIEGHIETKTDHKLLMERTEYHCARCGGHQGHVFNDGPKPTGLRYCNNGVALKFVPDKEG
ncbi:MAG: peptide-methionine (R)-S-oxide reductase MsrB [Alphaproteobacteria bacterium]